MLKHTKGNLNDSLGDRMKMYEQAEAGRVLMPGIPVIARLDGRSFHNFTKGLPRPYSEPLHTCMVDTVKELIKQSHATVGYTQSDEISLVWTDFVKHEEFLFSSKIQKLTSVLASIATVAFYRSVLTHLGSDYADRMPTFDCRVWQVPNEGEALNVLRWREWDCTKNSITMAASAYYSHTELHKKSGSEKQEMLWQQGINWNDYPDWFKRGTYVKQVRIHSAFTAEEIDNLPEKHHARVDPNLVVRRSVITALNFPALGGLANPEILFYNSELQDEISASLLVR